MLVRNWMTENVVTVNPDASMTDAIFLLEDNRISLLPVVENGRLVGIISDRDLKKASPSEKTIKDMDAFMNLISGIKVRQIMTHSPHTVSLNHTVEEAAAILVDKRISGLPVVDENNHLVGIITRTDIFKMLIRLTGLGKGGIQFAVRSKDEPGVIKEIKEILVGFGARTASVLCSAEEAPEGYQTIYVRIYGFDRTKLPALMEAIQSHADLLYLIDFRTNQRIIYQ